MSKPLICDNGLFVSLAAQLAKSQEVAYFSSWHNAFPTAREFAPANGIPNIERINDPIQFMLDGKASHLVVPDLYLSGYERLAKEIGIPVFGPSAGSQLETDRWLMSEFLHKEGHPVIHSVQLDGMDELATHLQKNDDKFVKVSTFRGDHETKRHVDWKTSQSDWYDRLKWRLGPIGDSVPFIVQDPIPSDIEIGIDTFYKGHWCEPMILGAEKKDAGFFGVLLDSIPEAFAPLFKSLGKFFGKNYNCFFSNEMRIAPDGQIYMTDATCRMPSPPGGVISHACVNLNDVVLADCDPDYGTAKFFCEIVLTSETVQESWLRVDFPKEFTDRYAFHNYCVIDGKTWIIPHDSKYTEFGSALGWGATKQGAKKMAQEAAQALTGDAVKYQKNALDEAEAVIEKAAE